MTDRHNIRGYTKIFSIAIIFLPFLYQFKGIGTIVSFGELILGVATLYILLKKPIVKFEGFNKSLLFFYIVSVGFTILCAGFSYFSFAKTVTVITRMFFYGLIIYVARNYFNLQAVKKIYYIAVFIFSSYLIIQYIYHVATNNYLPIYINYNWQFPPEARSESLKTIYNFSFRPSSLFLEPSYFAFYTLPAVCLLLYENKRTKFEIVSLIFSVTAIAISTSSSGIAGIAIIVICYLFSKRKNLSKKIIVILIAILLIICYLYFFRAISSLSIERLSQGASFNQRIFRGYLIYKDLPLFHKIFGVGLNNISDYIEKNSIFTIYDEANLDYMSSIVQTLNGSGIIGIVFLIGFYCCMLRDSMKILTYSKSKECVEFESGVSAAMMILLIYVSSYEAILFTYRFTYLLVLVEALQRIEHNS